MNLRRTIALIIIGLCVISATAQVATQKPQKEIPLSTSKTLREPVPGEPQRTNSLPVTTALSPDGKYLALLNNGFGSAESNYRQSISLLDLATNQLSDFPDTRLGPNAQQTYFLGLAWSADGRELYASMASLTDPEGKKPNNIGNGIAVYRFTNGALTPDRFIKLPLAPLARDKKNTYGAKFVSAGFVAPYPAGIAVVKHEGGD
ncbi:MAG TPA: phosphoesterase, partial [Terriglobales bacterium]